MGSKNFWLGLAVVVAVLFGARACNQAKVNVPTNNAKSTVKHEKKVIVERPVTTIEPRKPVAVARTGTAKPTVKRKRAAHRTRAVSRVAAPDDGALPWATQASNPVVYDHHKARRYVFGQMAYDNQ